MADLRRSALTSRLRRRSSDSYDDNKSNTSPVSWRGYFTKKEYIYVRDGKFAAYRRGDEGTPIICLHGGGLSGLSWARLSNEITKLIECQVYAVDLRGHGQSKTDNDYDLSLESLATDVDEVAQKIFDTCGKGGVLIGHSMGGAVAVEVAKRNLRVRAVILIDVVEGPAMDSLSLMPKLLRLRPSKFDSVEEAIAWSHRSGQTRSMLAARISMPGQIINFRTKVLAAAEIEDVEENIRDGPQDDVAGPSRASTQPSVMCIPEESEGDAIVNKNEIKNTNSDAKIVNEKKSSSEVRKHEHDNDDDIVYVKTELIDKPPLPKFKRIEHAYSPLNQAVKPNPFVRPKPPITIDLTQDDDDSQTSQKGEDDLNGSQTGTDENSRTDVEKSSTTTTNETENQLSPEEQAIYTWRTNLENTKPYWPGWFFGLSNKFLELECPKLLCLAQLAGLDTTLTVGQMQGRFQLEIFQKSGHTIHEDEPQRCAEVLADFLSKHQICVPKVPFEQFDKQL